MKRNSIFVLLFILMSSYLSAQIAPDKYYVQFSDKDNSPYSISNPEAYLSQRSIDRRNAQNLSIDMKDIPVNPYYISGVRNAGATILNPTKWLNGVTIETDNPAVISAIAALPYVLSMTKVSVKPVRTEGLKAFFENESYGDLPSAQSDLKSNNTYDYGNSFGQIHMVRGDEMHDMGYRGEGMVIGVLDAGFDQADSIAVFDSLWAENRVLGTKDFVAGGPIVYDKHFHGTGVLSIMAGNFPGELIGTAPKASYYLLRTEDAPTEYIIEEYNWVSGAEYADSAGCDVLNTSLGYSDFDDDTQDHTYEDMDGNTTPITIGADIAASRGMLVVNSAGNSGALSWYYITAPADAHNILSIGAVNAQGIPWISSGNGPTYDGRIKPDVAAQGEGTYYGTPQGSFTYGNGTSLSSPVIAGMMACLWQSCSNRGYLELMSMVKQSASIADNPDNKIGYGIPDFMTAYLLSVHEQDEKNVFDEIEAYPNPFINQVSFSFNAVENGRAQIRLVDLTGRSLREMSFKYTRGSNVIRINELEGLPGGIYFLRVENGTSVLTAKLLKN